MNDQFTVVGLGEVLWDLLPTGKQPGGAPANFAYTARQLGNTGTIAGRVGDDGTGVELIEELNARGLDCSGIQLDGYHPTGSVLVNIENGKPVYRIVEDVAWDFLEFSDAWRKIAHSANAVCFGSLAQRNDIAGKTVRAFVGSTNADCLRIFDVNLRQNYFNDEVLRASLNLANVCKLNHEELPIVSEMLLGETASPIEAAKKLKEQFGLNLICVTRGPAGSILISENDVSEFAGIKAEVKDTIGAGDAFTAAMAHGLLRNWKLDEINVFANRVGAFVASHTGAMPEFDTEFVS